MEHTHPAPTSARYLGIGEGIMDMNLSGKTAVVTGSTAGIGFACAIELARMGAAVIVTGRQTSSVNTAIAKIKDQVDDAKVRGVAADLGTAQGVDTLIDQVPSVDVLVNNVAIFENRDFFDISDAEWQQLFDVNIMSGVRTSRHYLKGMFERDWGRIVFIASESALHIPVEMIHYGMTKSASMSVARGIAELTKGTHVTCNSVLPGPTDSRAVGGAIRQTAEDRGQTFETAEQEFIQNNRPSSLIQRLASTEEVANMVAYACSPAASATNGAPLRVEGGIVRSMG